MGKIWLDVEDMFEYARRNPRPSGIQRVQYELCRSLAGLPDAAGRVGFVRHAALRNSFCTIPYAAVATLFDGLTAGETRVAAPGSARHAGEPGAVRTALRRLAQRLPAPVRQPLGQICVHQRASLAAFGELLRAAVPARTAAASAGDPGPAAEEFARHAAAGDVLASLGSPWSHPDYAGLIRPAQRRDVKFALLVYDLVPVRRPEWCNPGLVARFGGWAASVLPLADILLTISQASAADIARYAAEHSIRLRARPQVIPIGTGFTAAPAEAPARRTKLPPEGTYALCVATIEVRKNHALLFRVWRRLLEEMAPDTVPTLVFAGRIGWLVDDLLQQLRNAAFLDGKIVLIEDPTDAELAQLYRGCRFTLFPSLYEGWGLPVTESLGFGRPCIASGATSLPEAGGSLARYFDPDSATDACRVIRAAIEDPDGLAAWRARIAREFVPVGWEQSARAVLQALLAPHAG